MNATRQAAKVEYVKLGPEDHGVRTFWLGLDLLDGGFQGFGGLALGSKTLGSDTPSAFEAALVEELCALFHVRRFEDIKGRNCHALRCFDAWNEPIEGVEVDGKRWTLTAFCRRHLGKADSVLERRAADIHSSIARHARGIARLNEQLEALAKGYTDWERVKS